MKRRLWLVRHTQTEILQKENFSPPFPHFYYFSPSFFCCFSAYFLSFFLYFYLYMILLFLAISSLPKYKFFPSCLSVYFLFFLITLFAFASSFAFLSFPSFNLFSRQTFYSIFLFTSLSFLVVSLLFPLLSFLPSNS